MSLNIPYHIPRDIHFTEIDKKIDVAIGMRRVGKTNLIFQTIRQLLATGIPQQRMLCLNFEDDRLLPCTQTQNLFLNCQISYYMLIGGYLIGSCYDYRI